MSLFTTKLPTNIAEVLGTLPENSTIHGIQLEPETKNVLILWENSNMESGLTIPVEYTAAKLKSKQLPKGVKEARKWAQELVKPKIESKKQEEVKEAVKSNTAHYLSEEEYDAAVMASKNIEYMGIKHEWKLVNPKVHEYVNGYFYRLVDKLDVIP